MSDGSVLIVGAGGFIGAAVARGFRRSGYTVYGLVRKQEQADKLILDEVIPIIGDATNISTYAEYVKNAAIIVDCALVDDFTAVPKIITKLIKETPKDILIPKKVFFYTSGIMVYGHDDRIRDETWPISNTKYANKRREVESFVLESRDIVTPIVIRPGWVFGGDMGPHADLFKVSDASVPGKNVNRAYSWIHRDDLADAYVAAAKKGERITGEIFNVVNGVDNPKYVDLVKKGHALAGFSGEITFDNTASTEFTAELRDANVVLSAQKSIDLLDWRPKVFGLLENLSLYYSAFKLSQKK